MISEIIEIIGNWHRIITMLDPLFLLTVQAVLIWLIVFCAATPLPKIPYKFSKFVAVISTILIFLEIIEYNNMGLLATVALAGYSWGTIVHHINEERNEKREHEYLDGN